MTTSANLSHDPSIYFSIIVKLSSNVESDPMQSSSVSEQQSIQQDAPSSSLLSTSPSQRPCPTPLASQRPVSRSPQSHGVPRNTLSGMLANRPGNAPIPPSLQAKMTAVSASSSPQFWLQYCSDAQPRCCRVGWFYLLLNRLCRSGTSTDPPQRQRSSTCTPAPVISSAIPFASWSWSTFFHSG